MDTTRACTCTSPFYTLMNCIVISMLDASFTLYWKTPLHDGNTVATHTYGPDDRTFNSWSGPDLTTSCLIPLRSSQFNADIIFIQSSEVIKIHCLSTLGRSGLDKDKRLKQGV